MGSVLVGAQAVQEGIIDEVGGVSEAYRKLRELMEESRQNGADSGTLQS